MRGSSACVENVHRSRNDERSPFAGVSGPPINAFVGRKLAVARRLLDGADSSTSTSDPPCSVYVDTVEKVGN